MDATTVQPTAPPAATPTAGSTSPRAPWWVRSPVAHCLCLAGLGLIAYHNSFHGPFIFDDLSWIVKSRTIRPLWPLGPVLTGTPRPVLNLSFAINDAIGGTSVVSYHIVNLAIHLAAALALYGIVRRTILRSARSVAATEPSALHEDSSHVTVRAAWFAVAAAAIWLVHPLQTQSVTYIVQRGEALMGLFFLTCLYCVIRGTDAAGDETRGAALRRVGWYLGAVAASWLGAGSKEVMATAPVVVLLYDRVFLAASWPEVLRRRWGLYIALATPWCWLFARALPTLTNERGSAGFAAPVVSPVEYLLTQAGVLLHYLRLAFWPHPLCLDYQWPVARSPAAIVVPGLAVVALLLASVLAVRRRPVLGFLGLSVFFVLAPSSSFIPLSDLAVEHRMYLPLASVIVLTLLGTRFALNRAAERYGIAPRARNRLAAGALALVLISLTSLTILRNRDYRSVESIWTSVLAVRPDNPRAFNQLGRMYYNSGRRAEAYRCFRLAVALNDRSDAKQRAWNPYHENLASTLQDQGMLREAIHHYRRALRLQPRSSRILVNLGTALNQTGDVDGAIDCYRKALEIRPDYSIAHNNLALALEAKGLREEALRSFEQALQGEPKLSTIRLHMARSVARLGRSRRAIELYLEYAEERWASGDVRGTTQAIDAARPLAEELGDDELLDRLKGLEERLALER